MLTRRVGAAICAFGLFMLVGDGVAQQQKKADPEEQLVVPPERVGDPQAKLAGKTPWTLESAIAAYERFPDDIYLRYVVVQLAKDAKPREKAQAVERFRTILRAGGGHQVDAFSLFSGTHAVQESLQLDALLPAVGVDPKEIENPFGILGAVEVKEEKKDDDAKDKDAPKKETAKPQKDAAVPLKDLQGPGTKSHPWKKMLADKKPAVTPLSRLVPEDAWFVEVRSPGKVFALLEQSRDWMGYLATQTFADASDSRLTERLLRQMLLDIDPKKAADFEKAVGAVALTGSDLYLGSGSDVTILAEVKDADLFRGLVDPAFQQALEAGLPEKNGKHHGIVYRGVAARDRSVHVFIAEPRPGLHVRSNSLPGLKRVLDAVAGKTPNLGDTEECRFVRTLMPVGAREEDVFVYLSDPFLRRMVGAQVRLVERRRAIGLSHLRLITHAAELYATQYGKRPASLRDIEKSGLSPIFNVGPLASPFGGGYSLSADGLVGVCSILGTADSLTPIAELPHSDATPLEAKLYRDFVKEYSEYWKTYFDPIVCRVQVGPEKLRAETLILPLIDDTVYKGLAEWLGGPKGAAVRLDPLPVPNKNLFSVNLQFNKTKMLQELKKQERAGKGGVGGMLAALGIETRAEHFVSTDVPKGEPELTDKVDRSEAERVLNRLQRRSTDLLARGLDGQLGLHFYDQRIMFDLEFQRFIGDISRIPQRGGGGGGGGGPVDPNFGLSMVGGLPVGFLVSSFVSPVYLSIGVADAKVVDDYFEELDGLVRKYGYLMHHREMGIVLAADPHVVVTNGGNRVRAFSIRYGPFRWRTYVARIGNGIFITNQTEVIDDLHRAEKAKRPDRDLGPEGHGMIRMRPANWNRALAGFRYTWAENLRDTAMNDLHRLENVSRAHATELTGTPAEKAAKLLDLAERIDGLRYRCPQGGSYSLEPDGISWRSTLCGTLASPEQREAPAEKSGIATLMRQFQDLTATVTFLPEGLRAVVTIDRKKD
jgi:hypothetical protein